MKNKYEYWAFKNVIDSETCDRIISMGNKRIKSTNSEATILSEDNKKDNLLKKEIRKSKVSWFNDQWIYDLLYPYLNNANENAGWKYEHEVSEHIQFTKYGLNEYYGWHTDGYSDHYNIFNRENTAYDNYVGRVRKLSMSVSLSNPEDYEGGDLKFQTISGDGKKVVLDCDDIKGKGSVVVFPSYVSHTITPITKGERYSLVMWTLGRPFK